MLQCYDISTQATELVDASSKGMGAVLLQDRYPIAYASKSLTTTQQNYAQIEKEMLAIALGCKKFHDYVYGIPKITVETDHKPLDNQTIAPENDHVHPKAPDSCNLQTRKRTPNSRHTAPLPDKATELEFQQYDINIIHRVTEPRTNRTRYCSPRPTQNDTRWLARNKIRCTPWCQTILELS